MPTFRRGSRFIIDGILCVAADWELYVEKLERRKNTSIASCPMGRLRPCQGGWPMLPSVPRIPRGRIFLTQRHSASCESSSMLSPTAVKVEPRCWKRRIAAMATRRVARQLEFSATDEQEVAPSLRQELVQALADLLLQAAGHVRTEEEGDESEDID
jgi:hypothetical protein